MSNKNTIPKEEIERRLQDAHGSKYSITGATNGMSKVAEFTCNTCEHTWLARPSDVAKKSNPSGCPNCAGNTRFTNVTYDAKLLSKWGTEYVRIGNIVGNNKTKVEHFHTKCGRSFESRPNDALTGHGCPYCAKNTLDGQDFDKKLGNIAPEYVRVGYYINTTTPILFKHLTCGHTWEIMPEYIMKGVGCPKCVNFGFKSDKPAILYFLKVSKDSRVVYKIGITNNTVQSRYSAEEREYFEVLWQKQFNKGLDARGDEQFILGKYLKYKVHNFKALKSGNTELLSIEIDRDYNIVGE